MNQSLARYHKESPCCTWCGRLTIIPEELPWTPGIPHDKRVATRDHLVSRIAGRRKHERTPVVLACSSCNSARANAENKGTSLTIYRFKDGQILYAYGSQAAAVDKVAQRKGIQPSHHFPAPEDNPITTVNGMVLPVKMPAISIPPQDPPLPCKSSKARRRPVAPPINPLAEALLPALDKIAQERTSAHKTQGDWPLQGSHSPFSLAAFADKLTRKNCHLTLKPVAAE